MLQLYYWKTLIHYWNNIKRGIFFLKLAPLHHGVKEHTKSGRYVYRGPICIQLEWSPRPQNTEFTDYKCQLKVWPTCLSLKKSQCFVLQWLIYQVFMVGQIMLSPPKPFLSWLCFNSPELVAHNSAGKFLCWWRCCRKQFDYVLCCFWPCVLNSEYSH